MTCSRCEKVLDTYDVGFYRKIINRGATSFLCRSCLSSDLGMTAQTVASLIHRFQLQGCTLFPPATDAEEAPRKE